MSWFIVRRVAIIASASGNGKTTLGRKVATLLDVPFVELDALVHGPSWTETPDSDLRALVAPVVASEGWVIDGTYEKKLGSLVLDAADLVVWLDLPIRVWLPRLIRRTWRRLRDREELWNGNRESLSSAICGRDSLFVWALRSHFARRRQWPTTLGCRSIPVAARRRVRHSSPQAEPADPSPGAATAASVRTGELPASEGRQSSFAAGVSAGAMSARGEPLRDGSLGRATFRSQSRRGDASGTAHRRPSQRTRRLGPRCGFCPYRRVAS